MALKSENQEVYFFRVDTGELMSGAVIATSVLQHTLHLIIRLISA
jgi:hypothetical protein